MKTITLTDRESEIINGLAGGCDYAELTEYIVQSINQRGKSLKENNPDFDEVRNAVLKVYELTK